MAKKREKRPHLGRGLESLLGPAAGSVESDLSLSDLTQLPKDKGLHESINEVNIGDIKPNPYQPRTAWNDEELHDLTESIRTNGIIQPILVRPVETGFEVIAGERRLRAAKLAGYEKIPAMVREAEDSEMLELALVENVHRADLNPIERALAYQNYLETFSLTQTDAAKKLGEDRSVVSNYLRLLDLPSEIKQMLIGGQLSMGHARAILALPTDDLRRKLAHRALTGRLSVREVERVVRRHLTRPEDSKSKEKARPAHIVDLESKLRDLLGTRVSINARKNGKRGKIIIDFYTLDDFERLTTKMGLVAEEGV